MIEKIREYLKTKDIETENITDEELEKQYNINKEYLLKKTGINPETKDERIYDISINKFKYPNYIINDYPIKKIKTIKIDNREINSEQYYINLESGIIRWKIKPYGESLEIQYEKEPSEDVSDLIDLIVQDLIYTNLDPNNNINTIKEGDISISYENTNSTTNKINENIEKLEELYYQKTYSKIIR